MRIFFSVGEPSGDLHGANLIRDLTEDRPDVECVGFGGPKMAAAGCLLIEDLTQFAVMGVWRVLGMLGQFWDLMWRADRYFRRRQVDAVVLIDYPGFNWWIARRAKAYGIPVFYYGAPQMWGWAPWRARKMRRLVDHVLCKLPFEEPWYRQRGCNATYVGHPYFDELERRKPDQEFLARHHDDDVPLVTILPGSRTQEVTSNLYWLLKAAVNIRQNTSDVRFAIASFNEKQAAIAREEVDHLGIPADVFVGRTPELIELASCCMACSGSVSLELLYHEKPSVILYKVSRLFWLGQFLLMNVKYITLVNLLATRDIRRPGRLPYNPDAPGAEDVPMPEYLTTEDKSDWIAAHVIRWLNNPLKRARRVAQLAAIKQRFAHPGASQKAAQYILHALGEPVVTPSRTLVAA